MKQIILADEISRRKDLLEKVSSMKINMNVSDLIFEMGDNKYFRYNDVVKFINNECTNATYAKNAIKLVDIIEECKNPENEKRSIREMVVYGVLPYCKVEDVKSPIIKSLAENKLNNMKYCDRIIDNQNVIERSFSISKTLKEVAENESLYEAVQSIAEIVDSYNIDSYKKMILVIENTMYSYYKAFFKNPTTEEKREILESTIDYFLSRDNNISERDIIGYRKVLETTRLYSDIDVAPVNYIFTEKTLTETVTELLEVNQTLPTPVKKFIKSLTDATTFTKNLALQTIDIVCKFYITSTLIAFGTVSMLFSLIHALVILPRSINLNIFGFFYQSWKSEYNNIMKNQSQNIQDRATKIDQLFDGLQNYINSTATSFNKSIINNEEKFNAHIIDIMSNKNALHEMTICVLNENKEMQSAVKKLMIKLIGASKVTKELIEDVFNIIGCLYISLGTISYIVAVALLTLLYGLFTIEPVSVPHNLIQYASQYFHNLHEKYIKESASVQERSMKIDMKQRELESEVIRYCETIILIPTKDTIKEMAYKNNILLKAKSGLMLESSDFADSNDVKTLINAYKADTNKTDSKLNILFKKIYTKRPDDIIDETPRLLNLLRQFGVLSTFAINIPIGILVFMTDKFIEFSLKRDETERLLKHFKKEQSLCEKKLNKLSYDGKEYKKLEEYMKCLEKCTDKISEYRDNLYTDAELNRMESEENYLESGIVYDYNNPNDMHKIINECSKAANLIGKIKSSVDIDIAECVSESDIYYTNNDIPYTQIAEAFIDSQQDIDNIETMISTANRYLMANVYLKLNEESYMKELNSGSVFIEAYIRAKVPNHPETSFPKSVVNTIANLLLAESITEDICNIDYENRNHNIMIVAESLLQDNNPDDIYRIIHNSSLNDNYFSECVKDIVPYMNGIDTGRFLYSMNTIFNECAPTNHFLQYSADILLEEMINTAKKNKADGKPMNNKNIVKDSVSKVKQKAANAKKSINDTKNKVEDKVIQGSSSITNNIQLSLKGLRQGMADMSTKEKEISRNIDAAASSTKESIEKALTTNRREAIIKGSVVPSLSRIIKFGIAGAGIAKITSPVIAAISAIGALACSKKLTEREKQALLDEINIELKVVEKEISAAESDNNIERYRALLTYQKKLQKEEQRIKYNLKLYSKKYIPMDDNND